MGDLGINNTLLNHISSGGGAAWLLRQHSPDLIGSLRDFFETRTDLSRLGAAQKVSELVLAIHGMDELATLRDIVAKQELMRHIKYERQTDHTAHTVYLYLLGVWFYDNVPVIRNAVDSHLMGTKRPSRVQGKRLSKTEERARVDNFLFVWSYASLLHDIGYVFYDLSAETQGDRRRVDSIYSASWLTKQFPGASKRAQNLLKSARRKGLRRYVEGMPPATATYAQNAYLQVINRLAAVPWIGDLHKPWAGMNGFQILDADESEERHTGLHRYAREVAESGYRGGRKGRCVDHAVASGLLLLQYASYWYWIMQEIRESGDAKVIKEVLKKFDYKVENLVNYVVPACRATAYHNVQPGVKYSEELAVNFRLDGDPLLFLSVLCDELQRWDRFAAGAGHLENWRDYTQYSLESSNIELRLRGFGSNATAEVTIESPEFDVDKLVAVLTKRLPEWRRAVELTAQGGG